jgi:hypothetical protein
MPMMLLRLSIWKGKISLSDISTSYYLILTSQAFNIEGLPLLMAPVTLLEAQV